MKKLIFKGAAVALVTPMNKDGSVNYETLSELIEYQIKNGTDAIVSCGTTGESATLSEKEHSEILKFTVNKVNGRIPVIAGTGSNNTQHALELSQNAENLGCDALLIVTPYYNKTSQKGLIEHYSYIADRVNLPIITYTVPSRTGVSIKPETHLELSKHPNIVATKEASGNISVFAKIKALCGDNLHIYSGCDDQIVPFLSLGSMGVISVFSNLFPRECHEITQNFFDGNIEKSREMFLHYLDLMNMLFCDVSPIPVKEALNLIGFDCGKCRLPLTSLCEEDHKKLVETLNRYKIKK